MEDSVDDSEEDFETKSSLFLHGSNFEHNFRNFDNLDLWYSTENEEDAQEPWTAFKSLMKGITVLI